MAKNSFQNSNPNMPDKCKIKIYSKAQKDIESIYLHGSDNFIEVTLPTLEDKFYLTEEELAFLNELDSNFLYTREKLEIITGLNKTKLIRILNSLIEKKYIQKIGQGKRTLYSK